MKQLKQIWAVGLPEREQSYLKDNLEENHMPDKAAGLQLYFWKDSGEGAVKDIREKTAEKNGLLKEMQESGIIISGNGLVLSWAMKQGIATIGYDPKQSFLSADMIVEGFEEVDACFLTRVFERHHGIPWKILETERCLVRELEPADLKELFAMYAEPGMTDHMEGLYPYEEELAYQKAYIEHMYGFYGYGMWLVFEKGTGKLIGRAGIEHREELGGALELGYAIRTGWQRKGYATEVCGAILSYAHEQLGFTEIYCLIEKENQVSIHLAEKLGFIFGDEIQTGGKQMRRYRLEWTI